MFRGGLAIQGFPTGLSLGTYVGMVGKRSSFSSRIASCQHGVARSSLRERVREGERRARRKRREGKARKRRGEGREGWKGENPAPTEMRGDSGLSVT